MGIQENNPHIFPQHLEDLNLKQTRFFKPRKSQIWYA